MDGMEMAKRIRGMEDIKQPIIIFVTGYEKYVYDAFDVGAFQYLLKPIDEGGGLPRFFRRGGAAGRAGEKGADGPVWEYGKNNTVKRHLLHGKPEP